MVWVTREPLRLHNLEPWVPGKVSYLMLVLMPHGHSSHCLSLQLCLDQVSRTPHEGPQCPSRSACDHSAAWLLGEASLACQAIAVETDTIHEALVEKASSQPLLQAP